MLRNSIGCSTCREWDGEIGLYHYRARAYDPKIGRFIQPDPIKYRGGINLYTYVRNNPLAYVDPFGLLTLDDLRDKVKDALKSVPQYGSYGGPGHSGPDAPIDQMDSLFEEHDKSYDRGDIENGDRKLLDGLENLPEDPRDWEPPAPDPDYAEKYRDLAERFFREKLDGEKKKPCK